MYICIWKYIQAWTPHPVSPSEVLIWLSRWQEIVTVRVLRSEEFVWIEHMYMGDKGGMSCLYFHSTRSCKGWKALSGSENMPKYTAECHCALLYSVTNVRFHEHIYIPALTYGCNWRETYSKTVQSHQKGSRLTHFPFFSSIMRQEKNIINDRRIVK